MSDVPEQLPASDAAAVEAASSREAKPRKRASSTGTTSAGTAKAPAKRRTSVAKLAAADSAPTTDAAPANTPIVAETPGEAPAVDTSPVAVIVEPTSADEATSDASSAAPTTAGPATSKPKRGGSVKAGAARRGKAKTAAEDSPETTVAPAMEPDGTAVPDPAPAVPDPAPVVPDPAPAPGLITPPISVRTPRAAPKPRPKKAPARPPAPVRDLGDVVLSIQGLTKRFGSTVAVDDVDLQVRQGSFYGIVGPNGAGKTTTLSMITGLVRPDAGRVIVHGIDVWQNPVRAKRTIGVLPDTLRLFDRLTGAQLLYYAGTLRGLDAATVRQRSADLVAAFGIEDAVDRLVADYSAGMTKKIALAAAMIHSPRLLVLDEPFESVDPVSAANLNEILHKYVAAGGTVVLSSHGMDFIQRVCDHVAIIIAGRVLSAGTMDEVRGEKSLEDRFVELAGGRKAAEGMEWLHHFSD